MGGILEISFLLCAVWEVRILEEDFLIQKLKKAKD